MHRLCSIVLAFLLVVGPIVSAHGGPIVSAHGGPVSGHGGSVSGHGPMAGGDAVSLFGDLCESSDGICDDMGDFCRDGEVQCAYCPVDLDRRAAATGSREQEQVNAPKRATPPDRSREADLRPPRA
jgi:hypothetical protein